MQDIFIYSLAISTVFFLYKFLEMKFVPEEERKPLNVIVKETLIVYFVSVIGIYIYSQFDNYEISTSKSTMAFVDNPAF
jgi:uncharacterized membrane protein